MSTHLHRIEGSESYDLPASHVLLSASMNCCHTHGEVTVWVGLPEMYNVETCEYPVSSSN